MKYEAISMMRSLLESDETITQEQKDKVLKLLVTECEEKLVEVLSYKETCKRLNRSMGTLVLLINNGVLLRVRGQGKRSFGIRSDTLDKYLQLRTRRNGIEVPFFLHEQLAETAQP